MIMVFTTFEFDAIGLSEIGHVRKENEDAFSINKEMGLFVLADGMGGRKGGRIAADLAIQSFSHFSNDCFKEEKVSVDRATGLFIDGYQYMNEEVFKQGQIERGCEGMGTTFCALLLLDHEALISHIGDSRIYLFRQNELVQMTEDHTLRNEALKRYGPSEENLPSKHILSRAIGPYPTATPAIEVCPINKGDLFLICSDGLTNSLDDRQIKEILLQGEELASISKNLMQVALNYGGKDNITFILVRVGNDQSR